MMTWNYSNTSVETTLSGGVGASDTSISLGSTSGLPASFPYTLVIDYGQSNVEVVTVTGLTGSNLTVTRGQDGTAAQSHGAGAKVVHGIVARDLREPQQHIAAGSDVHGVGASASVVGTDTAQTLTNKTISGSANTLTDLPAAAVTGAATLTGLTVNGDASVTGSSTVSGSSTVGSESVTGNATVGGTLGVTGATTLAGVSATSVSSSGSVVVTRSLASNNAHTARVSGDTNDRYQVQADGKVTWGPGNVATDTNLYRSAADTLKTDDSLFVGGSFAVAGDNIAGSNAGVNAPATTAGNDQTTSTTPVNMAGTGAQTSFSFTKRFNASTTRLKVFMSAGGFSTTAPNGARFGVLINGVDTDVTQVNIQSSTVSAHLSNSGIAYITGVPAGTYTIQGRWYRYAGTGTIVRDNNDWLCINVEEVGL